jgi:hypothetical protein
VDERAVESDDAPDYASGSDSRVDPLRRQRRAYALTLVAVPLVVAGVLIAVGMWPSSSPSSPHPSPPPAQIAPEAPTDGKASLRLPVTITPNRDLVDGQVITISGTGFPANVDIAFATCTNASEQHGIDTCDLSTSTYMQGRKIVTNSDGAFSEPYTVRRYLTVAGQPVDCGRGNIDPDATTVTTMPGDFTCVVGAGVLTNYDISGGGPIAFAGAEFTAGISPAPSEVITPPPPTVESPPPSALCPNTTSPDIWTEEFNGTTMTVMTPPTPIYGPCPTQVP